MKTLTTIAVLILTLLTSSAATLWEGVTSILSPTNTQGLLYANELNASFLYKRDSDAKLNGGSMRLDWWLTEQQGALFSYDEFSDQSSYWMLGYQYRTVFKGIEVSLATGTRQDTSEEFGQVDLFLTPTMTYRVLNTTNWDIRITAGADIVSGTSKPNPFLGVTFRFLKF